METFFSVKGDAVKLLKHRLEILLQFVSRSAIFLIDWLDYNTGIGTSLTVMILSTTMY